ncbi:YcaO-like family protein [Kitasatospora sp. NPDC052896]|uniref:YcaO-like family protein n=1 Tax=Kitasatospora sp. NPDC052896 TaxID=3364061 RepID=UPI0037C76A37
MTSSLRTRSLDETLSLARPLAASLGITRVTDTTWLDGLGIPVFASIRPDAQSLCVNAGKGARPMEARVGAYMEAIEFAFAEYRHRQIDVELYSPRHVSDQPSASFRFVDLCPTVGVPLDPDGPLACVEAEDIKTGKAILVPAELVFSPYRENPGQQIFGTSTNGLCSGNSVDEAVLHGLCEVIERDIRSFNYVRDDSVLVDMDVMPPEIDMIRSRVANFGLTECLRYSPNEFGLPFFAGFIMEPSEDSPVAIAHGAGVHLVRDIAAVRALAEAAQSRLSHIHGGRDDLTDRHDYFSRLRTGSEEQAVARLKSFILSRERTVPFSSLMAGFETPRGIDSALATLVDILASRGVSQILRVILTPPGSPLVVVRVIVPKLEHFTPTLKRIGPRLSSHMASAVG